MHEVHSENCDLKGLKLFNPVLFCKTNYNLTVKLFN